MSNGSGPIIKTLALIAGGIEALAAFIGGMILLANESVWMGILVTLGGLLFAFAANIGLYGFGEMIEDCRNISDNTDYLFKLVRKSKENEESVQKTQSTEQQSGDDKAVQPAADPVVDNDKTSEFQDIVNEMNHDEKSVEDTANISSDEPVTPIVTDDLYIECPVCHTKQAKDRSACWNCGHKFIQ